MIKQIGRPFHQWDVDREISITNIEYDEINWCNKNMKRAIVTKPSSPTSVPNILLQEAENIYIYLLKNEQVVYHTSFGVCGRTQPEDYVYTETEHFTYTDFERRLKLLEAKNDGFKSFIWYIDTDVVFDSEGNDFGTLANCMSSEFVGAWFYAITSTTDKGSASYPSKYIIDGANGQLSLKDYVVWTGVRLVHISVFEAKASTEKDPSTGKYNWTSGVDGLMSSTDKAYLSDLINSYWGKEKLPVFMSDSRDGWMINWCRDNGVYLGGFKKDCGGHPPVLNDNHTSWVLMVFNGVATDHNSLNRNHRLQIAFDLVNSKIYIRRGWMSSGDFAEWTEVGAIADNSITTSKIQDGAVSTIKIGDFAITEGKLADKSITNSKIVDKTITEDKLDSALLEKIKSIVDTNAQILEANANLENVLNGGDV